MTSDKRLSRSELISEVARHTNLRRDVVEIVYDGLTDVTVSELVNKGSVRVLDTFDVTTKEWGASKVSSSPTTRLVTRITRPIHEFIREIRLGRFKGVVTPKNWRDHSYAIAKARENAPKSKVSQDSSAVSPKRVSASEMFADDY